MSESSSEPRWVKWEKPAPPSQEEIEAKLHHEGYESFRWHDVPGASYPRHRHRQDECLWVLKGELSITLLGKTYLLQPGDRLYLPANVPHTASVPSSASVTYLVGRK